MIDKIRNSIRRHKLFAWGDRVLVAVSGGADSVALLHALSTLAPSTGLTLTAAHLNHGIRGKAAAVDAAFVKKLASKLKIPFIVKKTDVPELARQKKISIEMAAREARYAFFAEAAQKSSSDSVVTAHTSDDQAETILLKLCRGAGAKGLSGIARKTRIDGLQVVRPMTSVSRVEIIAYLKNNGLKWREDATNTDTAHLRNRIRHEIIPFLEKKMNPDLKATLVRTGEILSEEDACLEQVAMGVMTRCLSSEKNILNITPLTKESVALTRRVLRHWLVEGGMPPESISFDTIDRIENLLLEPEGSVSIELTGERTISRQYDRLILADNKEHVEFKPFKKSLKIPSKTVLQDPACKIIISGGKGIIRDKPRGPGHLPARASLSATAIGKSRIIVRSWKPGDRIKPLGMPGTKKLQDIFVDEKVPVADRDRVTVFECRDEIIWIPGYRVASGWEVRLPTENVVKIFVEPV